MKILRSSFILLLFFAFLLIFSRTCGFVRLAEAGKRRIEIPDDLDDIVDDEEDEAWKEWGKKSSTPEFDPPPDFSSMNAEQIQTEMAKRTFGPVFGFVKLRLGVRRTREMVAEIAMKWTKVLRTGALGIRFMAVDRSTIMFNMENGKEVMELKEFILNQVEAYEIKIGDQVFRRPGDPPIEEVIEKLHADESKNDDGVSPADDNVQGKDEL